MITQSLKISQEQAKSIKQLAQFFGNWAEFEYAGIIFEFWIMKMPINNDNEKIGEENVYGIICKSSCNNSLWFEIQHQSYFD